jgi:glycosyltransferase involved in cell wall biosynthesis
VKTKISVILPVCNAEAELVSYVHDCLEISSGIGAKCEIVIIDDASTDATGDIAEKLLLEYPQVKVISQWSRQGLPKSILNGLRQVNGDLLYIDYILRNQCIPQISSFYAAMSYVDAVFGRFIGLKNESIGVAMLKKQVLPILGNSVANPEEAVSILQKNHIPYLELRYDTPENSNPLGTKGLPQFSWPFGKTPNAAVATH